MEDAGAEFPFLSRRDWDVSEMRGRSDSDYCSRVGRRCGDNCGRADMKTGRLTLALVAAAVLLALAVPQLSEPPMAAVAELSWGEPLPQFIPRFMSSKLARVAEDHPQDAQAWLGYAELGYVPLFWDGDELASVIEPKVMAAYKIATKLAPDNPAYAFRCALARWDHWWCSVRWPQMSSVRYTPAAKAANDAVVAALLQRVRDLDPDNAAPDYFLAAMSLHNGREREAFDAWRQALGKRHWSAYVREGVQAAWRVCESSGLRFLFASRRPPYPVWVGASWLAPRTLVKKAEQARLQGDDERAIFCYRAVAHLGALIRRDAYDFGGEGLGGARITRMISDSFLSASEKARLSRTPTDPEKQWYDEWQREAETGTYHFTSYLREHGESELAQTFEQESAEATRLGRRYASIADELSKWEQGWRPQYGMLVATGFASLAIILVGLELLVGLVSLGSRCWRGRRPLDQRLGWVRAHLARLRRLLPPTIAALLLLVVLSLALVRLQWQPLIRQQREIVTQGEMQYWGLAEAGMESVP